MVVVIVLFVLLTPRSWFRDQPRSATPTETGIVFIAEDQVTHTQTYRVDAKLFPSPKRSAEPNPELERETHEILSRSVDNLKDRIFQVRRISPVKNQDGAVQYYEVEVTQ
jgi:hypothetical protein